MHNCLCGFGASDIGVCSVAERRDVGYLVFINVGGPTVSVNSRVERLIVVVLDGLSLSALECGALASR